MNPVRFRRGLLLLALPVAMAASAYFVPRNAVTGIDLACRLSPPTWRHPLGTDELGRDLLARVACGAQLSLIIGVAVVGIAGTAGTVAGGAAGYAGGVADRFFIFISDVLLSFPGLLLTLAIIAVLGPGISSLCTALILTGWIGYARYARALTLSLRAREFIEAQRAIGSPLHRILLRHLLPNIVGPMAALAAMGVAWVVLAEGALSFLGLGVQPPMPSWGSMINDGRRHLLDAPALILIPGSALLLTLLGFTAIGEDLATLADARDLDSHVPPGAGGAAGSSGGRLKKFLQL